ncbi:MAG: prepilin-type N-terminal cleavage/methylation domain-containing protein [Verrucomicrobiota bacterium]
MISKASSKGFTLVEVMAAMVILVVAVGLALSGYLFILKKANQADIQHELDINVQTAIERLKADLRLSSMDEIVYYPEGSNSYTALSFPIAYDSDGDGLIERDANKHIIWDETIVYHIRPGTPDELVRTTLKPRNPNLSNDKTALQNQLNAIVADGDGEDAATGSEVATSKIIFANLLDWKLNPRAGEFSGYAPEDKLEEVSLGYALLNAGNNTFTFKVTGQHPYATGDYIGIDKFMGSPCYHYRDAETLTVIDGATVNDLYPSYGNRHRLLFKEGAGNSFTIQVDNDTWHETDFDFSSRGLANKENAVTETDHVNNDEITRLEGNELTWEAETQTWDYSGGQNPTNAWVSTAVRTLLKGGNIDPNGSLLGHNGARCRLIFKAADEPLQIGQVFFGESASPNTIDFDFNGIGITNEVTFLEYGTIVREITIPATETKMSNWIDVPIDTEKNYIASYAITGDTTKDAPKIWHDTRGYAGPHEWPTRIVKGDPTNGSFPGFIKGLPGLLSWISISEPDPAHPYILENNVSSRKIAGLAGVEVSYVEKGTYTSDIFDTMLDNAALGYISWNADIPAGTAIGFDVRSSDNPFFTGVPDFGTVPASAPNASSMNITTTGRYIQFRAYLQSSADHQQTPILRDVTTDWTGVRRIVNITGKFDKGPSFGNFILSVNGDPLQTALQVDLKIYEKSAAMNQQNREVSSEVKVEITPRNSGL